ncbi:MAG: NAD-dependent epimerase/dehydratase family protein [Saprospiraceae bacterium]|nr:NAD-dependent epimerase/dehydratase family protein [Candidatus Opimibacter skivensis]
MTTNSNAHSPLSILVTGGSGFLGKAIVEEFLDASCPVSVRLLRVYDLKPYPGKGDDRIEFIQGDICDPDGINKACEGMDVVIHAAAIVDWGRRSQRKYTKRITPGLNT